MSDVEGMVKKKVGKGLITKTLERCKWIGRGKSSMMMMRSRSWPSRKGAKKTGSSNSNSSCVAPEGCFSVYVGPQMQRFVIKTEYANHPLFKILLEEAESEYGYSSQGPLALPCQVDIFYKVLMEMEYSREEQEEQQRLTRKASAGCVCLNRSPSAYRLLRSSSVKP
ncbi:auxin-responsive protein SAUR36 [Vigna umbellata]|uniref:auxin-responsive protein SAUR36 n=1 Tax=Vigna umbellata TaxID=87088 RepID=UPI001F5EDF9F|nr:auxin-responsive protein SAUR36 [Vigna umbellata]